MVFVIIVVRVCYQWRRKPLSFVAERARDYETTGTVVDEARAFTPVDGRDANAGSVATCRLAGERLPTTVDGDWRFLTSATKTWTAKNRRERPNRPIARETLGHDTDCAEASTSGWRWPRGVPYYYNYYLLLLHIFLSLPPPSCTLHPTTSVIFL